MMAVWRWPILVVSEHTANAQSGGSGCSEGCNTARFGHIDRSRSRVTPTATIDCRRFHALAGRKCAGNLVSCLLRLLLAERTSRVTTGTWRSLSISDRWNPILAAVSRQESMKPSIALLFLISGVSFHGVKIMLWIKASAASGERPRMAAHSSFGISLVFLPTRLSVKGRSSSTRRA